MSTFARLSITAQYDELSRLIMKLIEESDKEQDSTLRLLSELQRRWDKREANHQKEKDDLRMEMKMSTSGLQKEIKKLNRQLSESRAALVRESNEKKEIVKERNAFMERMRQVRVLVESNDGFENTDAHRKRVIKCLDAVRLSPIQSDASDDSDNCLDLDYDKTEDDIMDTGRPQRKSGQRESQRFVDVLENLPATEQPTILCRYLDRQNSEEDEQQDYEQTRRKSRRTNQQLVTGQPTETKSRSASHVSNITRSKQLIESVNQNHNLRLLDTESESNGMETDDNEIIERCREQLKQMEREKREQLNSAVSTPNMKNLNKAATLRDKSTATLMKINSTLSQSKPATPSVMKPHTFVSKKTFRPDTCGPCNAKINFYNTVVKCEVCGITCHPECQDKCPLPCVKITAPPTRSSKKKTLISSYVADDAVPKVPAIIVHCCNEIEKLDKIRQPGLYRVVEESKKIEELLFRILKSKSGMPNLSDVDVHVLTGVVKRFLQNLDETLITTTMWSYLAEAVKLETDIDTFTQIEYYIKRDLPTANRETLAYLMQHFLAISAHSDQNNMTKRDLAKALAPTIIGNSCSNPTQMTRLNESKSQLQIMEALFKFDEDFWQQFVQKICPSQRDEHTNQQSSLGSRLLATTPTSSSRPRTRSSRLGSTLPTPKLKPLFSG